MEATTPAESARTEDPGLSIAREAAEVLPAESVRCNGNQRICLHTKTSSLVTRGFFVLHNIPATFTNNCLNAEVG